MSRRAYDDRPMANDPGMEDRPRPAMSPLGQQICRDILQPVGAVYYANFDNDTVTIESAVDFVAVAQAIARATRRPQFDMNYTAGGGEEGSELRFSLGSGTNRIAIRVADDFVRHLLASAPFALRGSSVTFDSTVPFDRHAFLRGMVAEDPEFAEKG